MNTQESLPWTLKKMSKPPMVLNVFQTLKFNIQGHPHRLLSCGMSPPSCSVWSPRATGRQLRFPTPLLRTPPSWGPDSSLHLFVQGVFCHQPTPLGSLREHGAHHDPSLGKHFALPPRGNVLSYHQTLESIFKFFFFSELLPCFCE